MATSEKKSKVNIIIIVVLAVVAVGLGVVLAITYGSRYDEGVKVGETKQIESIKADKNKAVVPDLVGQNAGGFGYWIGGSDIGTEWRIHTSETTNMPVMYKAPNGENLNEETAKNYKVVSQEPKANTVFDVVYGTGYADEVESMGVKNITVTLEKVQ